MRETKGLEECVRRNASGDSRRTRGLGGTIGKETQGGRREQEDELARGRKIKSEEHDTREESCLNRSKGRVRIAT